MEARVHSSYCRRGANTGGTRTTILPEPLRFSWVGTTGCVVAGVPWAEPHLTELARVSGRNSRSNVGWSAICWLLGSAPQPSRSLRQFPASRAAH